jgi:hypothetical protein
MARQGIPPQRSDHLDIELCKGTRISENKTSQKKESKKNLLQ